MGFQSVITDFLHAVKEVPLLGGLRYIELQGTEFDANGYLHRQVRIMKGVPTLEKLTLCAEEGFIMEYRSDKDKRVDETLLQFWGRSEVSGN